MRFPLAIILAFVVLAIVIDVPYVNAKNIPTTTDDENHLKTMSYHNTDQTTGKFNLIKYSFMQFLYLYCFVEINPNEDENITSKNDHTNKPCHNKHAPCRFTPSASIEDTESPMRLRKCPNGHYYHQKFGCVKMMS